MKSGEKRRHLHFATALSIRHVRSDQKVNRPTEILECSLEILFFEIQPCTFEIKRRLSKYVILLRKCKRKFKHTNNLPGTEAYFRIAQVFFQNKSKLQKYKKIFSKSRNEFSKNKSRPSKNKSLPEVPEADFEIEKLFHR